MGSRAERKVQREVRARVMQEKGQVVLEGFTLPHAYTFKYLGFWVSADGDTWQGMEKRLEQAADRFRVLGKVWRAAEIGGKLKLRIYVAGVLSVATYSSECWVLGEKEERYLRAWNARRLLIPHPFNPA